jgi:ACS family D-galactonate transporter-like MFS transporter
VSALRLGSLLCSGIAVIYLERVAISHSILGIRDEFNLSPTQQGWLLSAFSWGYVAGMIPGGFLIRRKGAYWGFVFSVLASGAVCACITLCQNYFTLFLARFCLGFVEAPAFPAAATMVRENLPPVFRAKTTAAFDAGSYIGAASVGVLFPFLIVSFEWRISMLLGPFLAILWFIWARKNRPSQVSFAAELNTPSEGKVWLPQGMLLQLSLISLIFLIYNFLKGFFLTWLPTFLKTDAAQGAMVFSLMTSAPFVFAIISEMASGWIMDRRVRAGNPVPKVRRYCLVIGLLGAALIYYANATTNPALRLLILVVSFSFLIGISPALWALPGDLAKRSKDTAMYGALINCISNIGGITSPIVIGVIVGQDGQFSRACGVLGVVALCGVVLSFGVLRTTRQDVPTPNSIKKSG